MTSVFASPSTYVQGVGVLFQSQKYIKELGTKILLLADSTVYQIVGSKYADYLKQNGFALEQVTFGGEASVDEIFKLMPSLDSAAAKRLTQLRRSVMI